MAGSDPSVVTTSTDRARPLTQREREILGLLAEGMSGAEIASQLVLSPETVRTHVRNAMSKLGASTRSQAVVLALRQEELGGGRDGGPTAPATRRRAAGGKDRAALAAMLDGLVSLYDVDGGAVYLADEDGLSLQRVARAAADKGDLGLPDSVALGDGPLGRVALERQAQVVQALGGEPASAGLIAAPVLSGGRLFGVIALAVRVSRPVRRRELLLLQAFANRVGDVLLAGGDVEGRLPRAMERFRSSWAGSTRSV
ncbi:MAG: LuxR C-terminal-related transcriptional regulator [Solirubrobacterales bacterium]